VTAPGQEPADDWKRLTATAPWWSRARFVAEPLVVALVFVTLAARLWRFVDRFAVSLVYWDQWDFLDGFFEGRSWIEQFRWQHGPHRQGLAGLYYGRIYPATGWSSRFEAFVAWGVLVAAAWIAPRLAVSLALLASAGAIAAWALAGRAAGDSGARRLRRALFLLCGYSTLFALMATAGRACLGPKAALAPRYTLYALPGMVGLYLWVSTRARRWRVPAVAALVLLLAVGEARAGGDRESARTLSEGRERWSVCYREKRSVELCDRKSGFSVYPADRREQTRLDDKLRYLEERSLSLFNGESGP